MENKRSLLKCDRVYVTDKLYVRIPSVGEILEDEERYLKMVNSLTAVPYQYMVQLDDMKIDFTIMKDYDLFMMIFMSYVKEDLSIIFDNLDVSDFSIEQNSNECFLYSKNNDIVIDEGVYTSFVELIRKIYNIEKFKYKVANEKTRKYLIDRERKRQKRHSKEKYVPYLEKIIIALVNNRDFKYDYDDVMDLSYYRFNQSFIQIQTNITFDKTMQGVYAGTVDTSKLKDKSCLSWIQTK